MIVFQSPAGQPCLFAGSRSIEFTLPCKTSLDGPSADPPWRIFGPGLMYRQLFILLVDVAADFPTYILRLCFLVRHHSSRGRNDRHTQAILYPLEFNRAGILTKAGTAHPFQ